MNKSCFIKAEKVKYQDLESEENMAKTTKTAVTTENKPEGIAMKSLKMNSEVENFYRFILENNLRSEAHILMKTVTDKLMPKKKRKSRKLQ